MAHVVFLENRTKTKFWSAIADRLKSKGHTTGWIVQNPIFAPLNSDRKILLPFPSKATMQSASDYIPRALVTDRGREYFDAGSGHYSFYEDSISDAFDQLHPDVVIGEPTLFHELLCIAEAKKRSIPFLHPAASRYPGGRFMVFRGDTQETVVQSDEVWSQTRLTETVRLIAEGKKLPSYMKQRTGWGAKLFYARRYLAQLMVLSGRLMGDRYNTPSFKTKRNLEAELKSLLKEWEIIAQTPKLAKKTILYPLQMQPEANIDVWGRPHSDQYKLIQCLLDAMPNDMQLAIKANPKSKYEVTKRLILLAKSNPRLLLLPLTTTMDDARYSTLGAITVSGTVGLEAVFGRGRCISLRHPILEKRFPGFHASSPEDAVRLLISQGAAGRGGLESGVRLLAELINESFEGVVSEPLYDQGCLNPRNVDKVAAGLNLAIAKVSQG